MKNDKRHNIWITLIYKMPSLFFGYLLYAVAILLTLYSKLGMSPWDVFHMGIVNHSILSLGEASEVVGFCIIILSIFLGVTPGIGSILNMIFIGLFVDLINKTGIIKTPENLIYRIVMLVLAIIVMGLATYFYLRVELGAGPRDGLMEGLVRKLNKPVWFIRGTIEVTALIIGFVLGGPVGIGTLLLALLIGPSVQFAFKIGKYDSKKAKHIDLIDLYRGIIGLKNAEIRKN
ncbi:MAG: membrane protein [Bacillota bacterium]|nr:membrane protein [Bacillota bacterium]